MKANYFNKDVSFESRLPVSSAVLNIQNKIKCGKLTGTIKPDGIILDYRHPVLYLRGIRFAGSFSGGDDGSKLTGTFRMPPIINFSINSLLLLFVFLFLYGLNKPVLMIIPFTVFILWLANFIVLNRWRKIDTEYVSQILRDALQDHK